MRVRAGYFVLIIPIFPRWAPPGISAATPAAAVSPSEEPLQRFSPGTAGRRSQVSRTALIAKFEFAVRSGLPSLAVPPHHQGRVLAAEAETGGDGRPAFHPVAGTVGHVIQVAA